MEALLYLTAGYLSRDESCLKTEAFQIELLHVALALTLRQALVNCLTYCSTKSKKLLGMVSLGGEEVNSWEINGAFIGDSSAFRPVT